MAQPSGQLLLDSGHSSEHFWYANDTGMWDAKNGAMLAKTGSGAVVSEGGANVVTSDNSTRYALASLLDLAGPWTLIFRARHDVDAGTASIVMGNTAATTDFVWLNNGSTNTAIRGNNGTFAVANTATALATYAITMDVTGTTLKIYKDGSQILSQSASGNTFNLKISHFLSGYTSNSFAIKGALEFVSVIPSLLDATEVAARTSDPYAVLAAATTTHDATAAIASGSAVVSGASARSGAVVTHAATAAIVSSVATVSGASSHTSGSYSAPPDVYIVAGQSNNAGRATSKIDPVATNYTTLQFDRTGVWKPLQEATTQAGSFDEGVGAAGSYFGALSNLLQVYNRPCGFVPRAIGSTTIANWERNSSNPTSTSTAYGLALTAANTLGDHTALMFWQGESDVATDPAVYEAALSQLVDNWFSDTGKPTFIIKTNNWDGSATAVRAAQQNVIDTNPHVIGSADPNVWTGDVHYLTTQQINDVADAIFAGMQDAFYSRDSTAALAASGAVVSGSASRSAAVVTHASSGSLSAGPSVVSGVSRRRAAGAASGGWVKTTSGYAALPMFSKSATGYVTLTVFAKQPEGSYLQI